MLSNQNSLIDGNDVKPGKFNKTATAATNTKSANSTAKTATTIIKFLSYANYRKFFKWRYQCSDMQKFVKFLLPIFILVNMLPFLYAGESLYFILFDSKI